MTYQHLISQIRLASEVAKDPNGGQENVTYIEGSLKPVFCLTKNVPGGRVGTALLSVRCRHSPLFLTITQGN